MTSLEAPSLSVSLPIALAASQPNVIKDLVENCADGVVFPLAQPDENQFLVQAITHVRSIAA